MGPVLLDAAMGTALLANGLGPGELPESWVLSRPGAVSAVHAAAAGAGAQVVLTCTFNLAGPRLEAHGLQARVEEIARAAVRLARAAAPEARVAGAVGPTALVAPGDSRPPSEAELRGWYEAPYRALAAAGADLLWAESHWDLSEARAALSAARATGLPAAVTLAPTAAGERLALPGGGDADEALLALASAGAAAVGVNCLLPGAPIAALASRLAPRLSVPLVVKPSAGLPGALLAPGPFAAWVAGAARAGAAWVGGCCGAGAAHLSALARALGAQEARG